MAFSSLLKTRDGARDRAPVLDYIAQPDPGMDHPAFALSFDEFDTAIESLIETAHAVRYWPSYQAKLTSIGLAARAAAQRAPAPRYVALPRGSLAVVFDRRADRALYGHARLQPAAARAEVERLNGAAG